MNVFQESSLSDSIIFRSFNSQAEFSTIINKAITYGRIVEKELIEEQLIQIRRTRLSPLVDDVLISLDRGDIVLVYAKNQKIPQALPFAIAKVNNDIKAFIFVNNYGTIVSNSKVNGGEYLNIAMKDLYVLLEGAYTALSYFKNPIYITRSLGLMKCCVGVYTSMFLRILNKEYALSLDQEVYNRVSFVIGKYFLDKVWESKNDDINTSYAMSTILTPNRMDLGMVNDSYKASNIKNIEELIAFLKTLSPRLAPLNFRYFTQCYITIYKASAIFSMECLPYFLFVMEATLIGSFLVNQPIISDIIKSNKNMGKFYGEIVKVL